jgi:hypothetical protein
MRLLPSPTGDLVLYVSPSLDYVCCWLVLRTLDRSKSYRRFKAVKMFSLTVMTITGEKKEGEVNT